MIRISSLFIALFILVSFNAYASSHGGEHKMHGNKEHKKALKHANPMPNFMKVVAKYGDELDLSDKQAAALKAWRKENGKKVHALVKQVVEAEKNLHNAAFGDTSQAELQDMMDKVLNLRLRVAQTKMRCRENMRSVLNAGQWNKLVRLYQDKVLARK